MTTWRATPVVARGLAAYGAWIPANGIVTDDLALVRRLEGDARFAVEEIAAAEEAPEPESGETPSLQDLVGARPAARLGKCGIGDAAALAALDDDALAALDVTDAMRPKLPEWRDAARSAAGWPI